MWNNKKERQKDEILEYTTSDQANENGQTGNDNVYQSADTSSILSPTLRAMCDKYMDGSFIKSIALVCHKINEQLTLVDKWFEWIMQNFSI